MKKTWKRLMALLLAAVMLLALVGCSDDTEDQTDPEDTGDTTMEYPEWLNVESAIPIVKEGYEDEVTLTVWVMRDGLAGELEDQWSWKYLTEVLNVNLEVTEFTSTNRTQLLSTAFSTNDLPDVIIGGQAYLTSTRLATFGAVDEQLVDLSPYINETLMPNLYSIYQENPEYMDAVMDSEGNVWSFGLITYTTSGSTLLREYLNYEWLEKLGLDEPETLDELLDVLRAFKADDPSSYPLAITSSNGCLTVLNALGYLTTNRLGQDVAIRDGEVVYPVADREVYAEVLEFYKTCWDEGLISPDFFTETNDEIGVRVSNGNAGFTTAYPYNYTSDYTDYWCIGPLTSDYSDTKQWPVSASALTCGGFVVTAAATEEEILLACRLADVLYNRHNYNLFNMGPNTTMETDVLMGYGGWSYGDAPTFTVTYHDMEANPDKWSSVNEYLWDTNRIWYAGTWGMHMYDGSEDEIGYFKTDNLSDISSVTDTSEFRLEMVDGKIPEGADHAIRAANYEYGPYITTDMYPSTAYYDEDTSIEIEELRTAVNTYAATEFAKFVTGQRALTDAELEDYFDTIDSLGAARLLEIYTEYYEDYLAAKAE